MPLQNVYTELEGISNWGDIATMSVTNTEDTSQATNGILELFKEFLIDRNFSFRCDDTQGWLFWVAGVQDVFARLSTGLESKLGDMEEEAVAKKNTAVESLVKEFGTLLYSSLKDLVDTMS